jgi:plastocyanin
MSRHRLAIVAAALLALLSCEKGRSAAAGDSRPMTLTITIDGTRFAPEDATVKVGDTIVWVNKDPFPHTATSKPAFDSSAIEAGTSWSYTASQAGEFPYVCRFHPTMKATLRVK